ncbi:hypothetical protein FF38_01310 [Lucilia cuprina]|uniref:Transmembrane protein n=1 Tax=Lucilia cuprina TaxID=7375 RepID=A0A0L0BUS2_LUCCU|nr:hypothetical protein FF38_01310 [Lucilia cuprina]
MHSSVSKHSAPMPGVLQTQVRFEHIACSTGQFSSISHSEPKPCLYTHICKSSSYSAYSLHVQRLVSASNSFSHSSELSAISPSSEKNKRKQVGRRFCLCCCLEGLRLLELVDAVVVIVPTFLTFGVNTFNSNASILVCIAISRLFCASLLLAAVGEIDSCFDSVFKSSASVSLKILLLLLLFVLLLLLLLLILDVVLRPLTNLVTTLNSLSLGDDFERFELVSVGVEVCLFALVLVNCPCLLGGAVWLRYLFMPCRTLSPK